MQVAMFENYVNDYTIKIYPGMQLARAESELTVQEILDALEEYVTGVTNETHERFVKTRRG